MLGLRTKGYKAAATKLRTTGADKNIDLTLPLTTQPLFILRAFLQTAPGYKVSQAITACICPDDSTPAAGRKRAQPDSPLEFPAGKRHTSVLTIPTSGARVLLLARYLAAFAAAFAAAFLLLAKPIFPSAQIWPATPPDKPSKTSSTRGPCHRQRHGSRSTSSADSSFSMMEVSSTKLHTFFSASGFPLVPFPPPSRRVGRPAEKGRHQRRVQKRRHLGASCGHPPFQSGNKKLLKPSAHGLRNLLGKPGPLGSYGNVPGHRGARRQPKYVMHFSLVRDPSEASQKEENVAEQSRASVFDLPPFFFWGTQSKAFARPN